jgi:hypothetical protein
VRQGSHRHPPTAPPSTGEGGLLGGSFKRWARPYRNRLHNSAIVLSSCQAARATALNAGLRARGRVAVIS